MACCVEPGADLREGTDVRVEPILSPQRSPETTPEINQLREGLLRFTGVIKDGPADLARNHDHYLHGSPRLVSPLRVTQLEGT